MVCVWAGPYRRSWGNANITCLIIYVWEQAQRLWEKHWGIYQWADTNTAKITVCPGLVCHKHAAWGIGGGIVGSFWPTATIFKSYQCGFGTGIVWKTCILILMGCGCVALECDGLCLNQSDRSQPKSNGGKCTFYVAVPKDTCNIDGLEAASSFWNVSIWAPCCDHLVLLLVLLLRLSAPLAAK